MHDDDCNPHGIERPDLRLMKLSDDDIPLVIWNVEIFRQSPGYLRICLFMSMDKTHIETTVETGASIVGPWRQLSRIDGAWK